MFYTYTEEEERNIQVEYNKRIQKLKDMNKELIKRLSLFVNKGKICGINSYPMDPEMYCDKCSIKQFCEHEYKHFSK